MHAASFIPTSYNVLLKFSFQRVAEIGMPIQDIDTPALIIDLDSFEHNLNLMSKSVASLGVAHRPHAKTHKSPVIARKQIAVGAVGQCCQKVSR